MSVRAFPDGLVGVRLIAIVFKLPNSQCTLYADDDTCRS